MFVFCKINIFNYQVFEMESCQWVGEFWVGRSVDWWIGGSGSVGWWVSARLSGGRWVGGLWS